MNSENKVTVVGYGNMGRTLCQRLKGKASLQIVEHTTVRYNLAKREHSDAEVHENLISYAEALRQPQAAASLQETFSPLIVLAIKPKELPSLIPTLRSITGCRILSILAGVPLSFLARQITPHQLARMMPSMAARAGQASSGLSFRKQDTSSPEETKQFRALVRDIAESMGSVYEVPEHLLSAITGLSGSGIAFALRFIDAMAQGGVREGLPLNTSIQIAGEVVSAAAMLCRKENPHTLIGQISSPAGTTIEGTHALDEGRFTAVVGEAIHRAAEKAQNIEESHS